MKILVIDDETALAELLVERLEKAGHQAQAAYRGGDGLAALKSFRPGMVLTDHFLPDISGMDLIPRIHGQFPGLPIVMMTGAGNSKLAVQAMRSGAEDYLEKPIEFDELLVLIEKIGGRSNLRDELESIKHSRRSEAMNDLDVLVGEAMQSVYDEIERVASMERVTVLIHGETGTGKQHVAKLLHQLSGRVGKPFVEFNCAAFPENLAESELFGFEAGAFTDAKKQKKGLLESAQGGTVFFDEVGELSPAIQAKLLKVLEDRESRRVGALQSQALDIRVVAASNRELGKEVAAGRFRADLYYRLNVYALSLPPLRERKGDVRRLARHFFEKACSEFGRKLSELGEEPLGMLEAHTWPGNVRELRNVMDGLVIRSNGSAADLAELGRSLGMSAGLALPGTDGALPDVTDGAFPGMKEVLDQSARSLKRRLISAALERSNGNRADAAKMLKVDYKTLYNLVKELDIVTKVAVQDAEEP